MKRSRFTEEQIIGISNSTKRGLARKNCAANTDKISVSRQKSIEIREGFQDEQCCKQGPIEIKRDGQRAALQHNALMLMPPVGDSKGYDGHPAQFRSGAGGKGDGEGHLSDSPSLTEPLQKSF